MDGCTAQESQPHLHGAAAVGKRVTKTTFQQLIVALKAQGSPRCKDVGGVYYAAQLRADGGWKLVCCLAAEDSTLVHGKPPGKMDDAQASAVLIHPLCWGVAAVLWTYTLEGEDMHAWCYVRGGSGFQDDLVNAVHLFWRIGERFKNRTQLW